jgi:hypothetical protein
MFEPGNELQFEWFVQFIYLFINTIIIDSYLLFAAELSEIRFRLIERMMPLCAAAAARELWNSLIDSLLAVLHSQQVTFIACSSYTRVPGHIQYYIEKIYIYLFTVKQQLDFTFG